MVFTVATTGFLAATLRIASYRRSEPTVVPPGLSIERISAVAADFSMSPSSLIVRSSPVMTPCSLTRAM